MNPNFAEEEIKVGQIVEINGQKYIVTQAKVQGRGGISVGRADLYNEVPAIGQGRKAGGVR